MLCNANFQHGNRETSIRMYCFVKSTTEHDIWKYVIYYVSTFFSPTIVFHGWPRIRCRWIAFKVATTMLIKIIIIIWNIKPQYSLHTICVQTSLESLSFYYVHSRCLYTLTCLFRWWKSWFFTRTYNIWCKSILSMHIHVYIYNT